MIDMNALSQIMTDSFVKAVENSLKTISQAVKEMHEVNESEEMLKPKEYAERFLETIDESKKAEAKAWIDTFMLLSYPPKIEDLPMPKEDLKQAIEENRKKWQEIASKIYEQRIEDLTKEIERLKAENEAVKRELRVQDMREVVKHYYQDVNGAFGSYEVK